jgi:hypothetical protein
MEKSITDIFLKMSKDEITFLANLSGTGLPDRQNESVLTSRLLDEPPKPYQLFGNSISSWGSSGVFKYVTPVITWGTQSSSKFSNGKLINLIPNGTIDKKYLGTNGEITEKTTSWAIKQVAEKKMSVIECVAIIRHRNNILSANVLYNLNLPIPSDNRNIPPLEWGPSDRYSFLMGNENVQREIKSIYRAHKIAEILDKFGADVQQGLSSGKYEIDNSDESQPIIYEWVENPYYNDQLTDYDLDGKPGGKSNVNYIIPTHIKRPIFPELENLLEESVYGKDGVSSTIVYLDMILAGVDSSGNKIQKGYGVLNSDIQEIITFNSKPHKEKSKIGKSLYGSKYYVYGATFSSLIALSLLSALREKYKIPAVLFRNWSRQGVLKFLEGPLESGLTAFKVTKDVTTNDGFRLIRDVGIYQIGHYLSHGPLHSINVIRIGGRTVLIEIPWVGWGLAAMTILYDIFEPIVKSRMEESNRKRNFAESCEIKFDDETQSFSLVGEPGYAYFTNNKLKRKNRLSPIPTNKNGIPIGAEKNPKTGNYTLDKNGNIIPIYVLPPSTNKNRKTDYPSGVPPLRAGGVRYETEYTLSIPEKLIQDNIKSNYFQTSILNSNIAENISNTYYQPYRSDLLPPKPEFPEGESEIIYRGEDSLFTEDLVFIDYSGVESEFTKDIEFYSPELFELPIIRFLNPINITRDPIINGYPHTPPASNFIPESYGGKSISSFTG